MALEQHRVVRAQQRQAGVACAGPDRSGRDSPEFRQSVDGAFRNAPAPHAARKRNCILKPTRGLVAAPGVASRRDLCDVVQRDVLVVAAALVDRFDFEARATRVQRDAASTRRERLVVAVRFAGAGPEQRLGEGPREAPRGSHRVRRLTPSHEDRALA